MKKMIAMVSMIAGLGLFTLVSAQATPKVTQRQVNQQARIQEGRQSGELTKKEAAGLELQQAKIQHDKREAKSDGVITPAERRKLHTEQRRANRAIYKQKHDGQTR